MKIAIYHNLPSGGAKRALHEIVRRLHERHEIDLFTLSTADHTFADLRPHVSTHHIFDFRPLPLLASPFGRLNQAFRLVDLARVRALCKGIAGRMEREGYDIVFVHPCQFEKSPSILRYMRSSPSVYYCQEPLRLLYEPMPIRPYDRAGSWKRRVLERVDPLPATYFGALQRTDRYNLRAAKRVLVNSAFVRGAVNQIYGVDAHVSYLGVDADFFQPLPLIREPFVLSVGSLTPLKGFDFLIASVAHIPVEQRPRLVIASNFQNPPEKAYLERLAQERHVSVDFLDNISDEQLAALYNTAQVVAYAPIREPFGLVPLEAMACSTPVVAVREGGVQESIVHEQSGLLVERDPHLFAEAISRLLTDPRTAMGYARNGREHVMHNWTWDHAVESLDNHLLQACGRVSANSERDDQSMALRHPAAESILETS